MKLLPFARVALALLTLSGCSAPASPAPDAAAPTTAASAPQAPAATPPACTANGAAFGAAEPGCSAPAAPAATAPALPAARVHVGAAFAIADEVPLAKALAAATVGEATVRVGGTISKVCQKKGCWMFVRDGDVEVRVVMKDYGFLVPIGSSGRKASVEGVLKVQEISEGQARHLAEDGGEDPNKVTGPKREYQLVASAIDIGG